jgi:hypothetical protein
MYQPIGRVVKLEYRDMQPMTTMDTSVLVVHIRGPDGEMYEHPLENSEWSLHNDTLQFVALNDFKPSDIDGTAMDVEQWEWYTPVAPTGDGFALAETVLDGGEEALREAEWFGSDKATNDADDDHSGPDGGGGPDPSTGNRGGVEEPSEAEEDTGVTAEITPDKNSGVEITVE